MIEIPDFKNFRNIHQDNSKEIKKIDSTTSYINFFENFLIPNKPCIITNITKDWLANEKWIKNNKPDLQYLSDNYGDLEGCISNCNERYFNAQKTRDIKFEDYVKYFMNKTEDEPLYYLKDWHLRKNSKEMFYVTPIFFGSDWLNEYFSEKTDDDYMFVYMGPKGTWTPFHVDVFTSYSWSTNVCGKKKWYLFPPGEETSLKDSFGNLPYDVTQIDCDNKYVEIIQNTGDAIFVPSGWHHQVWNLEDTISINHNWINGCNVKKMWDSIVENLLAVKNEIEDCKEMDNWSEQCQIMLKASHGIDFKTFYNFLCHIGTKRIKILNNEIDNMIDFYRIGNNHCIYDLFKIKEVLESFVNHEDFTIVYFGGDVEPNELLKNIEDVLIK